FHKMDTQEISDRFVAPCFVNGLEAYDGEINLGMEENMISNEFAMKLCLDHDVKHGNKEVKKELIILLRGEIYIVKFIINFEEDYVEPGVVLGRSFMRLTKGITDFRNGTITIYPELDPFLDSSEEDEKIGPSLSNGKPLTQKEAKREALAINIYRRYSLLEEERLVIKTMVYSDKYKKELGREEFKNVNKGITMLNHSKAEHIGILKDVLCQVGITTIITKFLILDMPIERDTHTIIRKGFLYTCGSILNTIEWITSTFYGICHQTFRAAKTSLDTTESDSDDDEEYAIQRNKFRASLYGPKPTHMFIGNPITLGVLTRRRKLELVRLVNFNEKYTKCLLLLVEVKTADVDQDSAHMVAASKVSMLKPGEFEIWRMRIDYALWEVIENGATLLKTQVMEGVMTEMSITSAEEKAQRRLEAKARSKKLSQEDVNQKLLSLSPEWNTHIVVWRNKADLDSMSMDNLYNNLKVYEPKVKEMSNSSSSTLNMAFMSFSNNNTSSTNGIVDIAQAINTANGVSTASTQVNAAYSTNIDNLSDSDQAEEGPNYALMAFSSSNSDSKVSNDSTCLKSCLETVNILKSQNEQLLKDLKKSELMVLGYKTSLKSVDERLKFFKKNESICLEDIKIVDNCKKGLGYENYNAVLPPYIGNFMPPTLDLSFTGLDEFVNKLVAKAKSSDEEPKVVRKNDDALIIEEWVSDNEEEDASQPKIEKKIIKASIAKIEFVKSKQQGKTARKTVK
nr:hypothetical protein [Tanacetum cinerariifolium]GEZ51325.1 hypothetical protein [Tanacetum cinerariifolium]